MSVVRVLKVLNRKTGKVETRDHVWVATGIARDNFEKESKIKESSLKKISRDPSESLIKDAHMRVASFVPRLKLKVTVDSWSVR